MEVKAALEKFGQFKLPGQNLALSPPPLSLSIFYASRSNSTEFL